MSYTANIPQATDDQSVSQLQILNNFIQLDASFGVNHKAFSAAADTGKHTIIEHIKETSIPATAVDAVKTYTIEHASSLGPMLFAKRESDGTPTPLTAYVVHGVVFTAAPAHSVPILDFNGMAGAIYTIELFPTTSGKTGAAWGYYNGATHVITNMWGNSGLIKSTAKVLQLGPEGSTSYDGIYYIRISFVDIV